MEASESKSEHSNSKTCFPSPREIRSKEYSLPFKIVCPCPLGEDRTVQSPVFDWSLNLLLNKLSSISMAIAEASESKVMVSVGSSGKG